MDLQICRCSVCVWPWHLELTWPVRKHRVDGEHDGCSLGEGSDACCRFQFIVSLSSFHAVTENLPRSLSGNAKPVSVRRHRRSKP